MKKVGIFVGFMLLAIIVAELALPALVWDGRVVVLFNVRVRDSNGKLPISNAKVQMIRDDHLTYLPFANSSLLYPIVSSDQAGLAKVTTQCGAGGTKGIFGKRGSYIITHELLVEAEGYRPISNALAQLVGQRQWPLSKRVIDVEVLLTRSP